MDFRKLAQQGGIAIQGDAGAYSHLATEKIFGPCEIVPCTTFEDAMEAVHTGQAVAAVLPVQNTLAGRVADMHRLLPVSRLFGCAEDFLEINHCLMSVHGATLEYITDIYTHPHAHPQCRLFIEDENKRRRAAGHPLLRIHNDDDTAIAARHVKEWGDPTRAAIASEMAAQIYGLNIIAKGIQDKHQLNATRFIVFTDKLALPHPKTHCITMLYSHVQNEVGGLTKLLSIIAGRGINMNRFECYESADFNTGEALLEVVGHPEIGALEDALRELKAIKIPCGVMGVMPMNREWMKQKLSPQQAAVHKI